MFHQMKRAATKVRRPRHKPLPEMDEGQILEMLRLTPEQRLFKAWRYAEFALELQHAARIRPRHSKPSTIIMSKIPPCRGGL
jgi:hypothetical protein